MAEGNGDPEIPTYEEGTETTAPSFETPVESFDGTGATIIDPPPPSFSTTVHDEPVDPTQIVSEPEGEPRVGEKRPLEDDLPPGSEAEAAEEEGKEKWPGWPGECVFRLIVPVHKVGAIIGRKGEFVKKMCEETRARIKIIDGIPGIDERVVLVSAKEEPESPLPPAVDGILRVHRQVVEGPEVDPTAPPPHEVLVGTITGRLLVPVAQAGSLIGRQGLTIKSIQEGSGASVRVLPSETLPPYALDDDRIVEVSGAVKSVYKALELILGHLRRFLVDRSVVPLFERLPTTRTPRGPLVPDYGAPAASWGGQAPASQSQPRGYGSAPEPYGDYYGSQTGYDQQQQQQQQQQQPLGGVYSSGSQDFSVQQRAVSMYGRDPNAQSRPAGPAAPPVSAPVVSIKEVTASMQIPLSYADTIIGSNGANILYLRRSSGATVSVQETHSSTGVPEMTVEIRGTTQQVQTAEQLLQSFIGGQSGYQQPAVPASTGQVATSYGQSTGYSDTYGQYNSQYNGSAVQPATQPAATSYDQQEYFPRGTQYGTSQDTYPGSQGYSSAYGY